MIQLVLGGARSGKSQYAEQQASRTDKTVFYIATATAADSEMNERIQQHQQQRPEHWTTVEEAHHLAAVLQQYAKPNRTLLVDCLTLWLSNILFTPTGETDEVCFKTETAALLKTLPTLTGDIILVSNEVGQGTTPMNAMARRFIDEAGMLHQQIAQCSDQVTFVTAGLPQQLKQTP